MFAKTKAMSAVSFVLALAVFLTGCSFGKSEPELTLAQIQATAQANAEAAIKQTQAAMPTATQPPSPTPQPPVIVYVTETPAIPLPSQAVFPTAAPAQAQPTNGFIQPTGTNEPNCAGTIDYSEGGPKATVTIWNKTKGQVTLSMYLEPNKLNQCGSQSVSISGGDSATLSLYSGCYFLYAWINDPQKQTTVNANICIGRDARLWVITYDLIEDRKP
jgi:hypothetical protein